MKLIEKKSNFLSQARNPSAIGKSQSNEDFKAKIELHDGNIIEAAVFSMILGNKVEKHACISAQAGCKFGCKFCTSGKNGFKRDLTYFEILHEINLLLNEASIEKFDHIAYMGIGEPLDNFDNVVKSINKLINDHGNRIGLATCGIPDKLVKLAKITIPIDMLWVSLHAPTNEKRSLIMPINKKFPVEVTMEAAETYALKTNKHVWLNYLVYKGFNDTDEDIQYIIKILKGKDTIFNLMLTEPNCDLILAGPNCYFGRYEKASLNEIILFRDRIVNFGLKNMIHIFIPKGKNVDAKCGEFLFTPSKNDNNPYSFDYSHFPCRKSPCIN